MRTHSVNMQLLELAGAHRGSWDCVPAHYSYNGCPSRSERESLWVFVKPKLS